jgi:hypothetical protein
MSADKRQRGNAHWTRRRLAAGLPAGNLRTGTPPPRAPRYEVRVTRDGVIRATILDAEGARQTVHDAVHLGLPVSCRLLAYDEPGFPGIREQKVGA